MIQRNFALWQSLPGIHSILASTVCVKQSKPFLIFIANKSELQQGLIAKQIWKFACHSLQINAHIEKFHSSTACAICIPFTSKPKNQICSRPASATIRRAASSESKNPESRRFLWYEDFSLLVIHHHEWKRNLTTWSRLYSDVCEDKHRHSSIWHIASVIIWSRSSSSNLITTVTIA